MRARGTFGVVLVAGLMLAACTKQGGNIQDAAGRVARQAGTTPDSTPLSSASAKTVDHARFAALPDRGELLRYGAQAPILDGAYTWHRTELSEQHALDAITSGTLKVMTPDGRLLGFQYDRSIRHKETGDWTWIGHLPGQAGIQAILTFGAGAAYGSIGQPDQRPLRLTMRGGTSWLVETDPTQLASLASHAANPVSPDYQIIPPAALERVRRMRHVQGMQHAALAPSIGSAQVASTPTVDLLIGYTAGFVTAQGSQANAITRLNSLVDTANAGLVNSQVNGQIRIVATMQVNYTDLNSNDTALDELTGYDVTTQSETTPNPAFNALRAAREQYGADLVTLIRPFREPEHDSCGIAWLVGGSKQGATVTPPTEPNTGWDFFGYSVVSDGTDKNETDGKTYFCEEHTLAHELGHNMGSAHDRATQMSSDGVLDDPGDYGAFAYSFGYKPTQFGKNFYTIMAYGNAGQTSYLTFSNPNTTFCGNNPCGVANSEDNARSLGTLLPIVAQFRAPAVVTIVAAIRNDFNGDGKSDVLWRNASSGQDMIWKSANSATPQTINGVSTVWKAVGVGDFNGDGKGDILWRNSSTGANSIWTSGGAGAGQAVTAMPDSAWQVAGIGDFDGDGKSDILWRNASTGANTIWKSADSSTSLALSAVGNLAWKVAAVADFDGDGKADILWRNTSTGANTVWKSGNSNTVQTTTAVTNLDWMVAGTGDFDGDGKADIFWRNAATGADSIWKSANSQTPQIVASCAVAWRAVEIGDYTGDGKADILWRNSSTGVNTIWKSANNQTAQAVSTVSDLTWTVVP